MAHGLDEQAAEAARAREAAFIRFGHRHGSTTSQPSPKEPSMSSNIYRGVAHVPDDPRLIAAAALVAHLGTVQERLKIALEQKAITINLLQSINEGMKRDHEFLKRLGDDFEAMFGVPFPKELPKEGEDVVVWLHGVLPDRNAKKAPQTPDGTPRRIRRPGKAESGSTGHTDGETTSKWADYKSCHHVNIGRDDSRGDHCRDCGTLYCDLFGHTASDVGRKSGDYYCHVCRKRLAEYDKCRNENAHTYGRFGFCKKCNSQMSWAITPQWMREHLLRSHNTQGAKATERRVEALRKAREQCAKRGHVFEERVEGERVCDDCGHVERIG